MAKENGIIIFLNGTSSSGKTTIANALVERLPNFEHMHIDDYFGQDQDLARFIEEKDVQNVCLKLLQMLFIDSINQLRRKLKKVAMLL